MLPGDSETVQFRRACGVLRRARCAARRHDRRGSQWRQPGSVPRATRAVYGPNTRPALRVSTRSARDRRPPGAWPGRSWTCGSAVRVRSASLPTVGGPTRTL